MNTTSWTRIRTVNGLPQETFEDAARAIGLVHGVEEYTICLQESIGAFDRQEMQELADQLIPQLTQEQKTVFDAITSSVIQQEGGVYMIDAPAGTGKTFTETTIAASLRARGTLVLCTAPTGIAALILPGGLTAHSTFKLPFGPDAVSGSTCNIKAESQRADVLCDGL